MELKDSMIQTYSFSNKIKVKTKSCCCGIDDFFLFLVVDGGTLFQCIVFEQGKNLIETRKTPFIIVSDDGLCRDWPQARPKND